MLWQVETKDSKIQLTPQALLDALLAKHLKTEREDFEVLSVEFAKFMQYKEALHEASILQLILIAFSLGYHYKVFRDKNKVEIIDEAQSNRDSNSTSVSMDDG